MTKNKCRAIITPVRKVIPPGKLTEQSRAPTLFFPPCRVNRRLLRVSTGADAGCGTSDGELGDSEPLRAVSWGTSPRSALHRALCGIACQKCQTEHGLLISFHLLLCALCHHLEQYAAQSSHQQSDIYMGSKSPAVRQSPTCFQLVHVGLKVITWSCSWNICPWLCEAFAEWTYCFPHLANHRQLLLPLKSLKYNSRSFFGKEFWQVAAIWQKKTSLLTGSDFCLLLLSLFPDKSSMCQHYPLPVAQRQLSSEATGPSGSKESEENHATFTVSAHIWSIHTNCWQSAPARCVCAPSHLNKNTFGSHGGKETTCKKHLWVSQEQSVIWNW